MPTAAEVRDIIVSVLFGLGFIVFFLSIFGFIWLIAFGVAKARLWLDSRRQRNAGP